MKASKDEAKELRSKMIQKEEERKKKSIKDNKSNFSIFLSHFKKIFLKNKTARNEMFENQLDLFKKKLL